MTSRRASFLTIEVQIPLQGSMLEMENAIRDELNKAGCLATAEALKEFDTDGTPITISDTKLTARKAKASQHYECPYGTISVERYLYQSNEGGYTYCPLEDDARILLTATPLYSQIVSKKYARMNAGDVKDDLETTLRRSCPRSTIQNIAEAVASVAQCKEEKWNYDLPPLDAEVASIGVGLDGAYVRMVDDGWREAMCGTISYYDAEGERLHTAYFAAPPEKGKQKFHEKMDQEIGRAVSLFPQALTVGLGDGAKDNWTFLESRTQEQVLDFWHVSEYVHDAADAYWGDAAKRKADKEKWVESWLHILKHEEDGAVRLMNELVKCKAELKGSRAQTVQAAITYFSNHLELMKYGSFVARGLPIGSGVTEAACKTVVKSRMCVSGAGWKSSGVGVVLTLRTLVLTPSMWDAFWTKFSRYGTPDAKTFGILSEKS